MYADKIEAAERKVCRLEKKNSTKKNRRKIEKLLSAPRKGSRAASGTQEGRCGLGRER